MLRVGRSGVRMPVRNIDFSLLRNVQNGSGSHLASYSMGTAVLCGGQSGRGLKLTTHLHPLPRLRMNGVILLRPLYAFMAWTGKSSPFTGQTIIFDSSRSLQRNSGTPSQIIPTPRIFTSFTIHYSLIAL